ncbi:hypothetical protein AAW14_30060 [Streptomyces hygroscopicus]|nr:hypothetical protein [Streptomyces hygroscopicus]
MGGIADGAAVIDPLGIGIAGRVFFGFAVGIELAVFAAFGLTGADERDAFGMAGAELAVFGTSDVIGMPLDIVCALGAVDRFGAGLTGFEPLGDG